MIYTLLVIAAFGSLFLPMPSWAKALLGFAFIGLGIIFLLFGLAGSYWDSHMTPGTSSSTSTLVTGVLLLLSRATVIAKIVLNSLFSPPS